MKSRIESLDYARGFTVLIMPTVHTVMVYSLPWIHKSWLGMLLAFLAEGPGAQLFVFVLGFSIVIARPRSLQDVVKRSLVLLAGGYILNLLRLVLPYMAGVLTGSALEPYLVFPNIPASINLLLTGDILQMAGVAYCIVQIISRMKYPVLISLICFIIVAFVAPYLWDVRFQNVIADHVAGLFAAKDYRAFFPLFPWLCYPLAGFIAGRFYKSTSAKQFFNSLIVAGVLLMITGVCIHVFVTSKQDGDFYRAAAGRTIYQTGFVLLWLFMWHMLSKKLKESFASSLLIFCSKHISAIYIIQWLVITWGVSVAGYQSLDMTSTIIAIIIVNAITFLLCRFALQLSGMKPFQLRNSEITVKP